MKTRHTEILFRFRQGQAHIVSVCLLTASFCLSGVIGCSEQPTPTPQSQEAKKNSARHRLVNRNRKYSPIPLSCPIRWLVKNQCGIWEPKH